MGSMENSQKGNVSSVAEKEGGLDWQKHAFIVPIL